MDGSAEPTAFQGGAGWQFGPDFSPDGRYVAYTSTEGGRAEVYVAPFPSGEKRRVTRDGGFWPRWSRDGRRLFFARGTGIIALDVSTGGSFTVGDQVEIVPQGTLWQIAATRWPSPFDVSADGARFLIQRPIESDAPSAAVVHVLFDWLSGRSR